MIASLLSLPRLAALGVGLLFAGLLAWQHLDALHWRKESSRFEQLYTGEQLALANTVAGYRAAADQARAADLANVQRVTAAQQTITKGTQDELEVRLAAARADAVRLRGQAAARPADPGAGRAAPVPGVPASPGGTAEAAGQDQLPEDDALTATEQAIQLDELIKWVKRQSSVDPNADGAGPAS